MNLTFLYNSEYIFVRSPRNKKQICQITNSTGDNRVTSWHNPVYEKNRIWMQKDEFVA